MRGRTGPRVIASRTWRRSPVTFSHVADCGLTTPRMADSDSLRMSTHFLCVEVPPRSSRSLLEITARLPAATHRSSPHSPFPSSAPQLASPHSPRPACRSSSSALVVSPSLSLALSCMSVSPSRGSRRLSLPLALVGSRRPSLSLSRPHASPGCPAAPRQLCCPLMRVSAGAGRSSGSGT